MKKIKEKYQKIKILFKSLFKNKANIHSVDSYAAIKVMFENTTDEVQDCVLFGANLFTRESNFGNNKGVIMHTDMVKDYAFYMNNLIGNSWKGKIQGLRVQCADEKDLSQKIYLVENDIAGNISITPISLALKKSPYQFQSYIIEDKDFKINNLDGNIYIKFKLRPKGHIHFTLHISQFIA